MKLITDIVFLLFLLLLLLLLIFSYKYNTSFHLNTYSFHLIVSKGSPWLPDRNFIQVQKSASAD